MADSEFNGFDINALMAVAGAQAVGSQKAKLCADIVAAIGSNPIYEIRAGSTVLYRTTISGSLTSSSAGIPLPAQFVEPPTVNVSNALTGSNVVEVIRSAANPSLEIVTPLKSGGGTGFLTASKGLDGSYTVRTSGRLLTPPTSLDVSTGGGSTGGIYQMQTLIDDMTTANDNGWYMEAAPNTQDSNGPGGTRYAQINIALRRSDGRSHWPGEYLSDSAPQGVSLSDSTVVYCLPWYVIGRANGVAEKANVRIQVRDLTLRGLKTDGTWETIASTNDPMTDSSWHANFRRPGEELFEAVPTGSGFAEIRVHSSADGGGASLGSIGYGNDGSAVPRRNKWTNHGYGAGVTKTRKQWIDTYKGLTFTIEARAIKHDPNGADNTNNTGLLMWIGADWYRNSPQGSYINGVGVGRLRVIDADWQLFSMSEQSMTDLANYPITGFDPA